MELSMAKSTFAGHFPLHQPFLLPTALPCQSPRQQLCQLVQHGAGNSLCCLEQQELLWKPDGFSNTGM